MEQACTDQEFIELFRALRSVAKVASALKISPRSVASRRRRIESRYHIDLSADDPRAESWQRLQTWANHPQRLDMGILNGTVIVFSDAHFWPGLRTTAYSALLFFISLLAPKAVVCNGDAFDGASISRFPRIGWDRTPKIIEELHACEANLGEIEAVAKKARFNVSLFWPLGNHDGRFENRLAAAAPEYEHVKGFSLKDHFPAWTPCWSVWNGEETVIKHRFRGGIHAAHNNTVNAGINIVTGHLHSLKVTPYDDYRGTRYGVDTGTLAEPTGPQFENYLEHNPTNWRSGFVVLTFKDGRLLQPEMVKVWSPGYVEFRGEVVDVSSF